jgi:outer membrane protein TolC
MSRRLRDRGSSWLCWGAAWALCAGCHTAAPWAAPEPPPTTTRSAQPELPPLDPDAHDNDGRGPLVTPTLIVEPMDPLGGNGMPGNGKPEKMPMPRESRPLRLPPPNVVEAPAHLIPITLDTVLRLASDQNGQINVARAKVQEAFAAKALAEKRWLPDLYAGPAYYRHEGGIQDFTGNLIHSSYGGFFGGVEIHGKIDLRDLVYAKVDAERKIWQQHGELAKLTNENLLDAANTYIDLLAARAGEAVGVQLEEKYRGLLSYAEKRAKLDKRAEDEAHRVQTEIYGQQQINRKLREAAKSATAKLIYLLGLDPNTELAVLDQRLAPLDLVAPNLHPLALVDQALSSGPGIRELEGLLGVIEEARAKASGPGRYLPTMEVTVAEGAFGAGPGDSMRWDNRLDIALQARWNLTDLFTGKERSAIAQTKMAQAQLTYQELRGKLTMGVHEAHEASLSGRDQIRFGEQQVEHAQSAYDQSFLRLKEFAVFKGSLFDVLLAVKSLSAAQFELVRAIRSYDQAQIRLLVVTGMIDPAHRQEHIDGHVPHGGAVQSCPGGICPLPRH